MQRSLLLRTLPEPEGLELGDVYESSARVDVGGDVYVYSSPDYSLDVNTVFAITGDGSALDQIAVKDGWLARFPMWDWVGGRTSELSAVGLLPAALQGIDIDAIAAKYLAVNREQHRIPPAIADAVLPQMERASADALEYIRGMARTAP